MQVIVNGDPLELPESVSVSQLLQQLELGGRRVAVEINQEIVPQSNHGSTLIQDGDKIEVVQAIGGG